MNIVVLYGRRQGETTRLILARRVAHVLGFEVLVSEAVPRNEVLVGTVDRDEFTEQARIVDLEGRPL